MARLRVTLRVSCQFGAVKVKEGFRLCCSTLHGTVAHRFGNEVQHIYSSGTGSSRGTLGRRPVLPDGFFFARRSCKALTFKGEGKDE